MYHVYHFYDQFPQMTPIECLATKLQQKSSVKREVLRGGNTGLFGNMGGYLQSQNCFILIVALKTLKIH